MVRAAKGAASHGLDRPFDHPDDPTDPTGSVWIDDPSDVSRPDRSGADQIDAEHQPTDLAVGFQSSGATEAAGLEGPTCQPSGADGGPTTPAPLSGPQPPAAAATPRTTGRAPAPGRPAARRARPASPPQSPRGSPWA